MMDMMDDLLGRTITALLTLLVMLALRFFEPKVKLVYWMPNYFLFGPFGDGTTLLTHALTLQNLGRKTAEEVEIVHEDKPDFFKIYPSRQYEEERTPEGHHIIKIDTLGSNETLMVQILTYTKVNRLQYIRSTAGPAKTQQIQIQPIYSKWVYALSIFLGLVGAVAVVTWMIELGMWLFDFYFSSNGG